MQNKDYISVHVVEAEVNYLHWQYAHDQIMIKNRATCRPLYILSIHFPFAHVCLSSLLHHLPQHYVDVQS